MFWTLGSAASFSKIMKYLLLNLMVFFILFQMFPGKQNPGKRLRGFSGGAASRRFDFLPSIVRTVLWGGWDLLDYLTWAECLRVHLAASLERWGWAGCLLRSPFHVQLFPCYFASINALMIVPRAVLLQQFSQSPPACLRRWVLLLLPLKSLFPYSGIRASTEQSCERECRPHCFSAMRVYCLVNDLQYNFIKNWSECGDYCLYRLGWCLEMWWHCSSAMLKPFPCAYLNPHKYVWECSSF